MSALGRPRGSRKIPPDRFVARYVEVFTALVAEYGYSPTGKEIAAKLGISSVTLRDYCRAAGIEPGTSGP